MTCSICMCYNSLVICFVQTYTVNKYFTVIISCYLLLVLQSTSESSIDALGLTLYLGYWLFSKCMATVGDKWNLIKFSMFPCSFSSLNGISLVCCQHAKESPSLALPVWLIHVLVFTEISKLPIVMQKIIPPVVPIWYRKTT